MLKDTDVRRPEVVLTRLAHGTSTALIILGRAIEVLVVANHCLTYDVPSE